MQTHVGEAPDCIEQETSEDCSELIAGAVIISRISEFQAVFFGDYSHSIAGDDGHPRVKSRPLIKGDLQVDKRVALAHNFNHQKIVKREPLVEQQVEGEFEGVTQRVHLEGALKYLHVGVESHNLEILLALWRNIFAIGLLFASAPSSRQPLEPFDTAVQQLLAH